MKEERDERLEKAVREFNEAYKEWRRFLDAYAGTPDNLTSEEAKHWRLICERVKETFDEMEEAIRGAIRWEWRD